MPARHARAIASISDDSLHKRSDEVLTLVQDPVSATVDSLTVWSERYQQLAVSGVRSAEVAKKIALQLGRFIVFYQDAYGHDRVSTCLKRDVVAWQQHLTADALAPATVNIYPAALNASARPAPQLGP